MNCVHGTPVRKPCPDCRQEADDAAMGIITRIHPPRKEEGYACPRCGGSGTRDDGMSSFGMREDGSTIHSYRPPSKCSLCAGKGRVNITPVGDPAPVQSAERKDDAG